MVVEDVQVKSEEMVDLTQLDAILDEYEGQEGVVIPVLQKTQELYGYLPQAALKRVSRRMRVPMSQIYGVATFYAQFYLTPRGAIPCGFVTARRATCAAPPPSSRLWKRSGDQGGETTDDFRLTLECGVLHRLVRPGAGGRDRRSRGGAPGAEQGRGPGARTGVACANCRSTCWT